MFVDDGLLYGTQVGVDFNTNYSTDFGVDIRLYTVYAYFYLHKHKILTESASVDTTPGKVLRTKTNY